MKAPRFGNPRQQRGITLVVVLLLLLIVTILGLASMRGTILQQRMSANAAARSEAFQSAEAVLREAEATAATRPVITTAGCNEGLCAMPTGGAESAWKADGFWESGNARASTLETEGHLLRYVVEDMGEGKSSGGGCTTGPDMSVPACGASGGGARNYRIVAFSRTDNGAEVVLQTTYQVP